jgi:Amt family ammonium transporter
VAFFYAGMVRKKNVLGTMMQSFTICALVAVTWVVAGYSIAFGNGNQYIGDLTKFMLNGINWNGPFILGAGMGGESEVPTTIPETVFMMFQMTFAIITPALIIGAFVERVKFLTAMLFSAGWFLLAYVPVCHWIWGGGWLAQRGALDFAGGIVVHVNAGVAALVAALMVGPRRGFPDSAMPPHNMTLVVAGAAMLWVGWFGFNAGSALAANGNAGMTMLATHLSAAAGALAWGLIEWRRYGKPSVLGIVTGMVAGLGTITPASGFVAPWAAIVIGALAGTVCYFATHFVKRVLRIDDSLDVFPVHGVGGILGSVVTGLFVATEFGGSGLAAGQTITGQVGVQVLAVTVTAVWSAVVTWVLLKVLAATVGLRVSPEEENEGLDLVDHGERAYSL